MKYFLKGIVQLIISFCNYFTRRWFGRVIRLIQLLLSCDCLLLFWLWTSCKNNFTRAQCAPQGYVFNTFFLLQMINYFKYTGLLFFTWFWRLCFPELSLCNICLYVFKLFISSRCSSTFTLCSLFTSLFTCFFSFFSSSISFHD